MFDVTQHGETSLGIVEHVPRFAAPGLHGLHVVLDTDDGVRKTIGFLLRENCGSARVEHGRHEIADPVHDLHRPRFVEHEKTGLDPVDQGRNVVESC